MIPKFRAWDVHEKKIFTNAQLIIWNGNVYANDNSNLNIDNLKGWNIDEKYLMQSTGIKDKNGNEIFEADILKCTSYDGSFWYETVSWDSTLAGFATLQNGYEATAISYITDSKAITIEIIGFADLKKYVQENKGGAGG